MAHFTPEKEKAEIMQVIKNVLAIILGAVSIVSSVTPSFPTQVWGQVNEEIKHQYESNKTVRVKPSRVMESTSQSTGNDQKHSRTNRPDERKDNDSFTDAGYKLSIEQWLYQEWEARYGERVARIAVAIAIAESGLNTQARHTNSNGSVDYSLFQLNSVHKQRGNLADPVENVKIAMDIYAEQGWNPWVVYQTGKYRLYLN